MDDLRLDLGKHCSKCGEYKLYSEFYKDRAAFDQCKTQCKECEYPVGQANRRRTLQLYRDGQKQCSKCSTVKAHGDFFPDHRAWDGLCSECKACASKRCGQWYFNNREQHQRTGKKWREANKGKVVAWTRQWEQNNPEIHKARKQAWTAKHKSGSGGFKAKDWLALCEFYEHTCLCCGKQTEMTVDHVIPLSKGGANHIANIEPLCWPCNSSKRDKEIDYRDPDIHAQFMQSIA